MPTTHRYVLDANVFIQAYRRYYAFDLCPGFWESIPHFFAAGRIISVDRVRRELATGDVLDQWAGATAPVVLFAATDGAPVIAGFGTMMQWAQAHPQYNQAAKAEFAQEADGWLVAYAQANGCVVVTHEQADANVARRIPIPNVCAQFGVPYVTTFDMLRDLGVRFTWQP